MLGITLGISLGTSLGIDDGDLLGWLDGFWLVEGIADGDLLGVTLGISLGTSLGIADGDLLGWLDGSQEGVDDGDSSALGRLARLA